MRIPGLLVFIMVAMQGYAVIAQPLIDSLSLDAEVITTLASNYQPLWNYVNSHGLLSPDNNNLLFSLKAASKQEWSSGWGIAAGMHVVAKNGSPYHDRAPQNGSLFFNEYFLATHKGQLKLTIGSRVQKNSFINNELSSGDLGISQNARPIPGILLQLKDYISIPWTDDWVQFKGGIRHGWLEDNRRIASPLLHEKSAHVHFMKPWLFSVEMGLSHFAIYGGTEGGEKIEITAKDFWNIFSGQEASGAGSGGFVPGSHLGTLDLAFNANIVGRKIRFYVQKPWEDSQQIGIQQFFRKYVDNRDNLVGLSVENPIKRPWLSHIVLEYIHTKLQTGPGMTDPPQGLSGADDPDGTLYNQGYPYGQRENYYNNWYYNNGWTHFGQVIGSPLLLTNARMRALYGDVPFGLEYGRTTIYNSRLEGIHIGLKGAVNTQWGYHFFYTATKNFGNYFSQYGRAWERLGEPYHFEHGRMQNYSMLRLIYRANQKWTATFQLAGDFGEQKSSFGGLMKVQYKLR